MLAGPSRYWIVAPLSPRDRLSGFFLGFDLDDEINVISDGAQIGRWTEWLGKKDRHPSIYRQQGNARAIPTHQIDHRRPPAGSRLPAEEASALGLKPSVR